MTGETWLEEFQRWNTGYLILYKRWHTLKAQAAIPLVFEVGTLSDSLEDKLSILYKPWQKMIFAAQRLIQRQKPAPGGGTYQGRTGAEWHDELAGNFPYMVEVGNQLSTYAEAKRVTDAKWYKTVLPYFVENVEEAVTSLLDLILEMNEGLSWLIDLVKTWGPPLLALYVFSLFVKMGVKVPAK